jgi:H+/gluconate symporter-like permease
MSVGDTIESWSIMETVISVVVAFALVFVASIVV